MRNSAVLFNLGHFYGVRLNSYAMLLESHGDALQHTLHQQRPLGHQGSASRVGCN